MPAPPASLESALAMDPWLFAPGLLSVGVTGVLHHQARAYKKSLDLGGWLLGPSLATVFLLTRYPFFPYLSFCGVDFFFDLAAVGLLSAELALLLTAALWTWAALRGGATVPRVRLASWAGMALAATLVVEAERNHLLAWLIQDGGAGAAAVTFRSSALYLLGLATLVGAACNLIQPDPHRWGHTALLRLTVMAVAWGALGPFLPYVTLAPHRPSAADMSYLDGPVRYGEFHRPLAVIHATYKPLQPLPEAPGR